MIRRISLLVQLKLYRFGIWVFEPQPFEMLDERDKKILQVLWDRHDEVVRRLDEQT